MSRASASVRIKAFGSRIDISLEATSTHCQLGGEAPTMSSAADRPSHGPGYGDRLRGEHFAPDLPVGGQFVV